MKKLYISLLLTVFTLGFSQNAFIANNLELVNGSFVPATVGNTNLQYSDIDGSPYINKNFREASIAENFEKVEARYDSYRDLVEYQSNDETRVVPKESQFNRIQFTSPNEVLVLANFGGAEAGYYYLLAEGNVSLFKELRTKFNPAKKATSSYGEDKAPFFNLDEPIYYIQIGEKILKQPKNEKQIIEIFPAKKMEIESFVKQNKIKFNKEGDLIKLIQFLNK